VAYSMILTSSSIIEPVSLTYVSYVSFFKNNTFLNILNRLLKRIYNSLANGSTICFLLINKISNLKNDLK